jgi:hypothetical protein
MTMADINNLARGRAPPTGEESRGFEEVVYLVIASLDLRPEVVKVVDVEANFKRSVTARR